LTSCEEANSKMRIILIYPPHPYLVQEDQQSSIGLLYLAAVLEENGHEVAFVDLSYKEEEDWLDEIPDGDIYGLSATCRDYMLCKRIAMKIKKERDGIIILGGPHATTLPNYIDYEVFDSIVIGEGEISIVKLVDDYSKGKLKRNYLSPVIEDLDSIPFPARHLMSRFGTSVFAYRRKYSEGGSTVISMSRGCCYNCAFCSSDSLWTRRIRCRSVENVVAEIKEVIEKYNTNQFRFNDETMTLNRERLFELCERCGDLEIYWRCSTRTDSVRQENPKGYV
jgi:anaerobic magnesium-protoporphyrin IX monomethyl ester cyclase